MHQLKWHWAIPQSVLPIPWNTTWRRWKYHTITEVNWRWFELALSQEWLTCIFTYTHTHLTHTYIYTLSHAHALTWTYTHANTHMHSFAHTHVYTYTHAHTHPPITVTVRYSIHIFPQLTFIELVLSFLLHRFLDEHNAYHHRYHNNDTSHQDVHVGRCQERCTGIRLNSGYIITYVRVHRKKRREGGREGGRERGRGREGERERESGRGRGRGRVYIIVSENLSPLLNGKIEVWCCLHALIRSTHLWEGKRKRGREKISKRVSKGRKGKREREREGGRNENIWR